MKQATYSWQVSAAPELSAELVKALEQEGIAKLLQPYAANLGLHNEEDCRRYFKPDVSDLHNPYLLYDLEKSVARIRQAIEACEKILVYGDYDADGITSTTVLKEAIEMVGGEVIYYVPNRFKDGYGPNKRVYEEFINFGAQLIVTVDNGVSGHEAIDYANSRGVDVIVTDHHELPEVLPNAYSIVHPRHPKGNYPFGQLAGVGVAFKVATALLEEIPTELLELVAIGTVADLVPLVDENRTLVQLGLAQFPYSDRLGLQALCKVAKILPQNISEEDIGFQLAPRLNALGRLKDATEGVDLLSTFDQAEADQLASDINATNEERKELVTTTMNAVLAQVNLSEPVIFAAHATWHEGVLGIVAGKLMQEYHKPAFILTIDETTQIAKGSARSVGAFNVFAALQEKSELFKAFGGHHMAAGFSLPVENLSALNAHLNARFAEVLAQGSVKEDLAVPLQLSGNDLSLDIYAQIQKLAPFGNSHEKPAVLVKECRVASVKTLGVNDAHLKFQILTDGEPLEVISFNRGAESFEFSGTQPVDVVASLNMNQWNGNKKLQLQLIDYRIEGCELFDYRGQTNRLPQLDPAQSYYFVFNDKDVRRQKLSGFPVMTPSTLQVLPETANLIIADCPADRAELKAILQQTQAQRIFLWCYTYEEAYLNGMPNRTKFAMLYNFIQKNPRLDVRYKLKELAAYFKMPSSMLFFMINVFSELNFVTIDNGVLSAQANVSAQDLTTSKIYQRRLKQMKTEEFLLYAKLSELKTWLQTEEDNHES